MASGILKYKAAAVTLWSVRTNEGINYKNEKKWWSQHEQRVRRPAMSKLSQEQLQKRLSLVAITAMTVLFNHLALDFLGQ
jgi:hypothetical protein